MMQKFEIRPGEEYLLREARKADAPLQRVKILQDVRGKKWKAEWIEPNPGLVEYVESQDLVVRWKDRKAFLRDEERARQRREHNERQGYIADSPLDRAIGEVFESVAERPMVFYRGILEGSPDAVAR